MTTSRDASPQVGKGSRGHTELSNELLEAIYAYPWASTLALRAVLFIVRDSYGWKRKETRAYTFPAVAALLDAERTAVFKAFRYLKQQGVVVDISGGWGLVKNYHAWGNTPELPLEHPLPTGNGCPQATDTRCPQATKSVPTGNRSLPTGNLYRRKKGKKERKGGEAADSKLLPNGKTDTPRHRAELGSDEHAPEDHPDFERLTFKMKDDLNDTWKERRDEALKKNACRKGCGRPRAAEAWPYCRPCTVCETCGVKADGKITFTVVGRAIVCSTCK